MKRPVNLSVSSGILQPLAPRNVQVRRIGSKYIQSEIPVYTPPSSSDLCSQLRPSILNIGTAAAPIYELGIGVGAFQPHIPEISNGGLQLDNDPPPTVAIPARPINLYAITVWDPKKEGNTNDGFTMNPENVRTYFEFGSTAPNEIIVNVDPITGNETEGKQVEWWATIHDTEDGDPIIFGQPECGTCQPQFCQADGYYQLKFNREG